MTAVRRGKSQASLELIDAGIELLERITTCADLPIPSNLTRSHGYALIGAAIPRRALT